jgi:hypothetical protein
MYEGDVRFEHCYAVDEGAESVDAKKDCWRAWLHSYTYGQPRDRVEYAAARYGQLSLGPTLPSEEGQTAPPRRREATVGAPMPTNAFAPPPNLAASAAPSVSAHPPGREALARAPGAECSDGCTQRWTACRDGCDVAPAAPPATPRRGQDPKDRACEECDRAYRTCVPACFNEGRPPRGAR